jgi:hypothetical protein
VASLDDDFDLQAFVGPVPDAVLAGSPTPERFLRVASLLFQRGARREAYAVLVQALSVESGDPVTTEMVVELLPLAVLDGLAAEAEARGEPDIAGILEAVALVSGGL